MFTIEQVLDYFHFSYAVSDRQRENIPSFGKVSIIASGLWEDSRAGQGTCPAYLH